VLVSDDFLKSPHVSPCLKYCVKGGTGKGEQEKGNRKRGTSKKESRKRGIEGGRGKEMRGI